MTARPRCDRGHFLPAGTRPGPCHCHQRTRPGPDLYGQGLRIQYRDMTTVTLVGSYL